MIWTGLSPLFGIIFLAIPFAYDFATTAMYEILKKGRKFNLSISCQYDLFAKIVRPILLYGCEIWGYTNVEMIERVHLKFCKLCCNPYCKNYP